MLVLSVFINYVDRGSLSIAAPLLSGELQLSPSRIGILLSCFFWTYAVVQLFWGWAVDRFDAGAALAIGFVIWSVATVCTGFAMGFASLLGLRLLLGAGESVAYPAYSKILSRHFPAERRGLGNSSIAAGLAAGPAFGTLVGGVLMGAFGWRPFFIVLGLTSLVWLVPWMRVRPRDAHAPPHPALESHEPTMGDVLRQRSAWGTFAGLFGFTYQWYFLLAWLPFFLVRERQLSMAEMGTVGGVSYLCFGVASLAAGWLSDRWIGAGRSRTTVRKGFMAGGQAIAAIAIALCAFAGPETSVALLMVANAGLGLSVSNLWAITQTLAGPKASGKWTGIENFFGSLAGIASPAVAGFAVEQTGHFSLAFAITAVVGFLGVPAWIYVVGPIEQVRWRR